MDNRKKLGIFIIIIGLLIIAGIIYFIFIRPSDDANVPTTPTATTTVQLPIEPDTSSTTPSDKPRNYQQYDISQEAEHEINATDVAKLATAFAERLGSFSNQSNYRNFEDLNIFMTASMRSWAVDYVTKMRLDNPYDGNYYGITTQAVNTEVKTFDDKAGKAQVVVNTQRREVKTDGGENNFAQDLRLDFVKQDGQWLVDGAYWEK